MNDMRYELKNGESYVIPYGQKCKPQDGPQAGQTVYDGWVVPGGYRIHNKAVLRNYVNQLVSMYFGTEVESESEA